MFTAGLLDKNGHSSPDASLKIIDLGFGCGDQSIYLANLFPDLRSYIGISISDQQVEFAKTRLAQEEEEEGTTNRSKMQLFCADAAAPASWNGDLKSAVSSNADADAISDTQSWVLALDTLYHFRPSRRPILDYVVGELGASLMAFDLVLGDSLSFWKRLWVGVICWVTGSPFGNFLTVDEYVAMLVRAGYSLDNIEVRDISGHVFAGIAGFIRRKNEELGRFGMGLGKFKAAGYVFDWWARSGAVRGVIVVARR